MRRGPLHVFRIDHTRRMSVGRIVGKDVTELQGFEALEDQEVRAGAFVFYPLYAGEGIDAVEPILDPGQDGYWEQRVRAAKKLLGEEK